MLLKKTTRHWPPRTPSPCPAHVHPGFLELPEATLATQPPSLQLLPRLLHAYGARKQLLRRVLPPGTERRSGFTHRRAHKCQGEVCHAGGLLQLSCLPARPRAPRGCRGSAPVRAHSPAEQAPDRGMAAGPVPCPAGNHEKKDQTKRKSAFQLLEEKVKANGHLLCTHSGGNCLEHIYKGHGTF